MYPENSLDPQSEEKIAPQIAQIEQYGGRGSSILIPNFEDDYGAYRPVGHYAGVPELECYFRSMTWLGRVAFKFKDPDTPDLVPSRAPLIMTLTLREAQVDGEPAYKVWTSLYEITNFMIGPTDDPGPLEVNALMEQIYVIQECLELKDCMDKGIYTNNPPEMDPIPVIAAVSGWEDSVLEAGVGFLDRIFVAVPLEGKLEIAQGGVFSYNEFSQPRSSRLTDQAWLTKLQNDPPEAPAWTSQFILPGGKPTNSVAFRIGDVYHLSEKGYNPPLNLRAGPSKSATILRKLDQEYYLTIKDGPIKNSEGTWWKVEVFDWSQSSNENEGWALENPEWFVRSIVE